MLELKVSILEKRSNINLLFISHSRICKINGLVILFKAYVFFILLFLKVILLFEFNVEAESGLKVCLL